MKHLASLILLAVICTVNYPSDCTIVNTKFETATNKYKASVECTYEDGSRSVYYATAQKLPAQGKPSKVDYLPSVDLTDSITMICQ